MSNLRPVNLPGLVTAMVESMKSIDAVKAEKSLPLGLSEPRWRVLNCIAEHHPRPAPFAALRLCSGLNAAALKEHLQALRFKGLVMFETNILSPSAMETVAEYRARAEKVQKRTDVPVPAPEPEIADAPIPGNPADAPACIRPDCTPLAPTVRRCRQCRCTEIRACVDDRGPCWWVDADLCSHCADPKPNDRGSAEVARPSQGAEPCHRHATDGISGGDIAVSQVRILPPVTPSTPTPLSPSETGAAGRTEEKANAAVRSDNRSAPEAGSESVRAASAPRIQPKPQPVQTVVVDEAGPEPQITAPVPATEARIAMGAHLPAQPWRGRDVLAERAARLASAIAYLKTRAILVETLNREAPVRTYRVSGKRDAKYAEEVIEIAMDMGWTE